ncbi:B12-binding domain-containing radical SAM protein [Sulfurimonas sp.]
MKRIVLCFPNNGAAAKNVSMHIPLSCLAAATLINEHYDVQIYDGRLEDISTFLELLTPETILVGISVITGTQIRYGLELSKIVKEKNIPTVWGGTHVSLLPEQTLIDPLVDYVVKGEGEKAILTLAKQLEDGLVPEQKLLDIPLDDFDSLPEIPYHLVDVEQYVTSIQIQNVRKLPFMFSRGCPFNCGYCSSGYLTKKWKAAGIDKTVERLHNLVEKYNLQYIDFFDENLTSDIGLLNKLATNMPDVRWMMQARLDSIKKLDLEILIDNGLDIISSGLESGSPQMLKLMRKGEKIEDYFENNLILSNYSVKPRYSYMMGFPNETYKDLMLTVDLALKMVNDNKNVVNYPFYVFQPYPGTPLAKKFDVKGCDTLAEWADFGRHNFDTPFVDESQKDLFDKITFSSKYTGRTFTNMFPDDQKIADLRDKLVYLWQKHDFTSKDWDKHYEQHLEIIHHYFGEHAY